MAGTRRQQWDGKEARVQNDSESLLNLLKIRYGGDDKKGIKDDFWTGNLSDDFCLKWGKEESLGNKSRSSALYREV